MKMVSTTSNASGKQSYPMWEEGVADSLADKLGISYSDAQGIIESNEFYMAQAWAKGMNEEQTADFIDKESTSMANGGSLKNSNVNVTNEMRGEDSDEYGTFEIYKDGGNIEVSIINSGKSYDRNTYEWLLGDFDKDGLTNSNDNKPLNKKQHEPIDSPNIAVGLEKLIALKKSLDSNMYSFVEELKNVAPDKSKIYARTKTPYSILDKLVKKRLGTLTDLIGTTIVTNDKKELDAVKRFVESGKLGRVTELEDMYEKPKQGYRAYHFLIDRNGTSIELQLKTKRQKAINELSHEPYKQGKLDGDKLVKMTELANRADEGDKAAIKEYNDFMKQPDIENVFYAEKGGYMVKGGGIDKSLISSIPKRRRADRKYTHFAVRKSDNKILNGWDYSDYDSAELNSHKQHYFYYDMDDMDVPKNEYTIKKAQTLIRLGVNPFDFDNWRNLDFSNDKPYVEGKMAYGGNIDEWDEEQYPSRRKMLESILSKEFGSMNQYSSSADWGGIPVWSLSGDDLEGAFIGIGDDDGLFIVEREQDYEVGDTKETEIMTASYDEIPKIKRMIAKAKTLKGKMAKGGGVGKGYKVFNYTDDIFASDKTFSNRTNANDFIKEFRKKYEGQGYYRDNRMRKIDVKDIDLLAIPSDFNPYKKMANGGGIGEDNEVLSFFKNIDYSKLPPAFTDYIKKEILTDDDLQYLSPREPIFLEIKSKVEGYSSKPTTQTTTQAPTETGQSEDVKKYMAEIADIQFLIDIETDEIQIAIYKQEIEDLKTLIELES